MLHLKLLLGVFGCYRGNLRHTVRTKCSSQKDVLGKGFSSNSWKAIYSTGRKAETLNLAVGGKKQLSLENCMEKEQEEI